MAYPLCNFRDVKVNVPRNLPSSMHFVSLNYKRFASAVGTIPQSCVRLLPQGDLQEARSRTGKREARRHEMSTCPRRGSFDSASAV
jgi:hypothetical protein